MSSEFLCQYLFSFCFSQKGGIDIDLADEALVERTRRSGRSQRRLLRSPSPSPPHSSSNKTAAGTNTGSSVTGRKQSKTPPPAPPPSTAQPQTLSKKEVDQPLPEKDTVILKDGNEQMSIDMNTEVDSGTTPISNQNHVDTNKTVGSLDHKIVTGKDHVDTNDRKETHKPHQQLLSLSKKRSPSPTLHNAPPTKRPALDPSSLPTKKLHSDLNNKVPPTKGAVSIVAPFRGSSASRVLTEEFQRKQGQENSKLKQLILKEIRKPNKSETNYSCLNLLITVI